MTDNNSLLVFTPLEASNATEKYVQWKQENNGGGMPLYIQKMEYSAKDKKGFLPVMQGEIITVLGRPGSGKTGFMLRWARERAKDLQKQAMLGNKEAANSVVLYVTLEQMVEELRLFHASAENEISATDIISGQANEKMETVKKTLRDLHTTPLWFIGKSRERRKNKTPINEKTLHEAFTSIEQWQGDDAVQTLDSIFIDYLQRFRPGQKDWVQFYGDTVNGLKDMAGDFSTRVILGVQAKREVDQRNVKIPDQDDGQWTSGIEQQSDGMLSVCRPSHYVSEGCEFDDGVEKVTIKGHDDMVIKCCKRKMGPENFHQWVKFRPEFNKLVETELRSYNVKFDVDDYREVENV
jgi:replicative DNA helicase